MAVEIVTRAEWGAASPRARPTLLHAIDVDGFVVHWSGKPGAPAGHETCAEVVRGIQRYHQSPSPADPTKPWNDIAYSHLICPHGFIFEGRGFGVRTAANGTTDSNGRYHAVCVLAGPGDAFPLVVAQRLRDYFAEHSRLYPGADEVIPHGSITGSDCPGDALEAFIAAKGYLPVEPKLVVRYELRVGASGKRRSLGTYRLAYLLTHPGLVSQAVKSLKDGESVLLLRRKVAL